MNPRGQYGSILTVITLHTPICSKLPLDRDNLQSSRRHFGLQTPLDPKQAGSREQGVARMMFYLYTTTDGTECSPSAAPTWNARDATAGERMPCRWYPDRSTSL